jgi:phage protein D/phage baseplate assembly protein gpV
MPTTAEKSLTGEWEIKVNCSPLAPAVFSALLEANVDTDMNLPDSASLQFEDGAQAVQADPTFMAFKVGSPVDISAKGTENDSSVQIFKGEITGIEVELTGERRVTIVRASDKSAKLHRGRKTKTYLKKKDSDVASELASAAGLSADVTPTTELHDYLAQSNQTDWEFLKSRAETIGYDLYAKDGKLTFKKPEPTSGQTIECQYGRNMLEFRARISSVQQVSKVTVNGWDVKDKQKITASESPSSSSYESVGMSLSDIKSAIGSSSEYVDVVSGPATPSAASAMAKSIAEDLASSFAEAEAYILGDNKIVAGALIETKGVGSKFEGKWRVTRARHIRTDGGYYVDVTCSGRMDRSLAGLTRQGTPKTAEVGAAPVIGIVTNIKATGQDQGKQDHRVKVKFPWLNDNEESAWARVMHPGAGDKRGFHWMPEVNDEVLVVFEHGDFNRPVVIGGLYNGKDLPVEADYAPQNSKTDKRTLTSRSGAFLQFDDSDGKEFVHLSLDKDKKYVLSMDKAGQKVIITSDGQIEIHGKMDIKIMSDNGKISLEASKGDIELKGMNVKMEAQTQAQLKGAMLNLEASGAATLKGATVSLG